MGVRIGVSGLCHLLCVIMPFCPQNYARNMPKICPGLCQNYAIYAKIMPFMLKYANYALCQNHPNCIMLKLCSFMLKLCSFMLKYANYAKIMPIMLYAPAMLLCQFLCWHNPLGPRYHTRNPCTVIHFVVVPILVPSKGTSGHNS